MPPADVQPYRRVFRPPRSTWWITLAAFVVVSGFTVAAFAVELGPWYRAGFVLFCALFPVGFAELALTHVTLDDTTLTFVKSFRRRVVDRSEIESVTWAKGAGVSVRLVTGEWVRLPEVGDTPLGLTNTIRAWVKRARRPAAEA